MLSVIPAFKEIIKIIKFNTKFTFGINSNIIFVGVERFMCVNTIVFKLKPKMFRKIFINWQGIIKPEFRKIKFLLLKTLQCFFSFFNDCLCVVNPQYIILKRVHGKWKTLNHRSYLWFIHCFPSLKVYIYPPTWCSGEMKLYCCILSIECKVISSVERHIRHCTY